jgi:segregation and condensation protein A
MSVDRINLPEPQGSDGADLGSMEPFRHGTFSVKLDVFEGPLDLMLYLIKRDEIDITDIPIAKITSEYLSLLKLMESLDLEIAGEYVLMAATLIRIKTTMLLPRDPDAEEEEDPREELVQALIEYRKFKEAAGELKKRESEELEIFARDDFSEGGPAAKTEFVMDRTLVQLLSAFRDVLSRIEPETIHRVEMSDFSVDDRIEQLEDILEEQGEIEFAQLFMEMPARWMIVLTLLALLEMARLRRVTLKQDRPFAALVFGRPHDWSDDKEMVA